MIAEMKKRDSKFLILCKVVKIKIGENLKKSGAHPCLGSKTKIVTYSTSLILEPGISTLKALLVLKKEKYSPKKWVYKYQAT